MKRKNTDPKDPPKLTPKKATAKKTAPKKADKEVPKKKVLEHTKFVSRFVDMERKVIPTSKVIEFFNDKIDQLADINNSIEEFLKTNKTPYECEVIYQYLLDTNEKCKIKLSGIHSSPNQFYRLPFNLILMIVKMLDINSVLRLVMTCQMWRSVLMDNKIWNILYKSKWKKHHSICEDGKTIIDWYEATKERVTAEKSWKSGVKVLTFLEGIRGRVATKKSKYILVQGNILAAQVGSSLGFWDISTSNFLGYKVCNGVNPWYWHFQFVLEGDASSDKKTKVVTCYSKYLCFIYPDGATSKLNENCSEFTQLTPSQIILTSPLMEVSVLTHKEKRGNIDTETSDVASMIDGWIQPTEPTQSIVAFKTDVASAFEKTFLPSVLGVYKLNKDESVVTKEQPILTVDFYTIQQNEEKHKHKTSITFCANKSENVLFSKKYIVEVSNVLKDGNQIYCIKVYSIESGIVLFELEQYKFVRTDKNQDIFIDEKTVILQQISNPSNHVVVYDLDARETLYSYTDPHSYVDPWVDYYAGELYIGYLSLKSVHRINLLHPEDHHSIKVNIDPKKLFDFISRYNFILISGNGLQLIMLK